jgi:hypothetical protein
MNFPDELDTDFYKNAYSDLKEFNQEQLIKHYFDYGKEEGRAGNSIINRKDFINIIKLHYYEKFGLEIGPLNNPAFSKDMNVKYADLLSFEKLKKKQLNIN